jgi:hypothetical protein
VAATSDRVSDRALTHEGTLFFSESLTVDEILGLLMAIGSPVLLSRFA